MVGRVPGRKHRVQGSTLSGHDRTVVDCGNRRTGGIVWTRFGPGLLHDLQTAEDAGHVLYPAYVVLVRMREDNSLQFIGVGEVAQATREIFGPFWHPDTGVQQKRSASRPDNVGVSARTGEWTGIMPKHSRNAWRQPGVVGQLEPEHRVGYDSLGLCHRRFLSRT